MPTVFVSYARSDQSTVQTLVEELRELGYDAFFDQNLTGGQRWWDVLLDRIQAADGFLPVLSEEYRQSEACHREANWAQALHVPFVPIDLGELGPELCDPVVAEANWVRYRLDDRASVARLARALAAMPKPEPPSPLPDRPAIPISYFAELEREIRTSPALTIERQLMIISTMRSKLGTREHASASMMLTELRNRDDVTYANAMEIDRLVAAASAAAGPSATAPATPSATPSATASTTAPATPPAEIPPAAPDQPAYEQPAYDQPAYEQPTHQQQAYQEATYQPAAYQQPVQQQPVQQQPSYQQPTYQQPTYQQQTYPQPTYQQPSYQQPSYQQPGHRQPAYHQPGPSQDRPRSGVNPAALVTWGAGAVLVLLSITALTWLSFSASGSSESLDYSKLRSNIDSGGAPGLSVAFFSWLGYLLFGCTAVATIAAHLVTRSRRPWVRIGLVLSAITLILTVVSAVLLASRAHDLGVSTSYGPGFVFGLIGAVLLGISALIRRRAG